MSGPPSAVLYGRSASRTWRPAAASARQSCATGAARAQGSRRARTAVLSRRRSCAVLEVLRLAHELRQERDVRVAIPGGCNGVHDGAAAAVSRERSSLLASRRRCSCQVHAGSEQGARRFSPFRFSPVRFSLQDSPGAPTAVSRVARRRSANVGRRGAADHAHRVRGRLPFPSAPGCVPGDGAVRARATRIAACFCALMQALYASRCRS